MIKYLCFLLFSLSLYSQEINIPTQFSQKGTLYKSLDKSKNKLSQPLTEFKENQKCTVIDYLGRDNYKVQYKDWEGLVTIDDLLVNEEMMDLYYDYQEKQRARLIASETERKKKIYEIVNKESLEILEQKRQDSIVQVKVTETKQLAVQEAVLKAQKRRDSIVQVKAVEKKQLEVQEEAKKLAAALKTQERQDSIVQIKAVEKKQLEAQEEAKKLAAALRAQKRQDSIVQVKAAEKKQLEAQEQAKRLAVALKEQEQQDSIAQVKAIDKRQLAIDIRGNKLLTEIRNKTKQDSIANASEVEKEQLEVQEVDVNEKEKARLERVEFRATCHYAINEYDEFYKKIYIRTNPYLLNNNLSVELYKYGQKVCVFFNLNEDLGCASYLPANRSKVRVVLENNQIITFYHTWDMDCGDFSFKGNLSSSQIVKLKESPIKSITLKGTKDSRDIINLDYKEFFMDKLKCIE